MKWILVIAFTAVLFVSLMMGQTPISLKIYATDGIFTDSILIGVHPSATGNIDPGLGEYELPPMPPTFDFRCASNSGYDTLGQGARINYHRLSRDTQTDIYRLQFKSDDLASAITFSWQSGLSGVGAGYWKLKELDGTPLCDMTAETSYTYHTFDTYAQQLMLVKGDAMGYLTVTSDSLIAATDYKNKQKAEKRKPYASEAKFKFVVPTHFDSINMLHVEYSQGLITHFGVTLFGIPPDDPTGRTKKFDYTGMTLLPGDTVRIWVIGSKGKELLVKKYWWMPNPLPERYKPVKISPGPIADEGRVWYRMPNWNNVGEETYAQTGPPWGTGYGIVVGSMEQQGTTDRGKPIYRYVYHKKWKDVIKTLYDKKYGTYGKGGALCLDYDLKGKQIYKPYKTLKPHKARQPNELLVEVLALNFNIGISQAGYNANTGFGELRYVNDLYDPAWSNDLTVDSIANLANRYISCDSTSPILTGMELLKVVKRVNEAFTGPFDTLSFYPKTFVKPARSLAEVTSLYRPSLIVQAPLSDRSFVFRDPGPLDYKLDQNYPNPFNPTTTIGFELSDDAIVTLKVYNLLGQEVVKIIDREEFYEGSNEVVFDASRLASGAYYYMLIVNDNQFQQIKKMILLK